MMVVVLNKKLVIAFLESLFKLFLLNVIEQGYLDILLFLIAFYKLLVN